MQGTNQSVLKCVLVYIYFKIKSILIWVFSASPLHMSSYTMATTFNIYNFKGPLQIILQNTVMWKLPIYEREDEEAKAKPRLMFLPVATEQGSIRARKKAR